MACRKGIYMTEAELISIIDGIKPVDREAMKQAEARLDTLAKPPGSLGNLEDIAIQLAGITGRVQNSISRSAITVFAADNGVTEEGVASAPQSVTYSQTINISRHLTGVGALADCFGADILVTDVGVNADFPEEMLTLDPVVHDCSAGVCRQTLAGSIVNRKIAYGTNNLAKEPAMSRHQVVMGIYIGIEAARAAGNTGHDIIGVGEMGIGNTTSAAAVLSALTDLAADKTAGRGGGLDSDSLAKKKQIIDSAVKRITPYDNSRDRVFEVLSQVGGFDIAAMTGAFLGAALYGIPAVIDGYISAVSALCAYMINPDVKGYLFGSHKSREPGYMYAASALGIKPMLDLEMRLGEGSGCPLAFQVIKGACAVMRNMATLDEGNVDAEYLKKLDKKEDF